MFFKVLLLTALVAIAASHEHHGHKSSHKQETSYGYEVKIEHTGIKTHHEVPVHHHHEKKHEEHAHEHHHHHESHHAAPEVHESHHDHHHHHESHHEHEPTHVPHYEFGYKVHDPHTHDVKSHKEERNKDQVKGVYTLVEADGHHKRIVEYTADKHSGFHANIRTEKIHKH